MKSVHAIPVLTRDLGNSYLIVIYTADSYTANVAPFAGADMYSLRAGRQVFLRARWNF